MTEEKAQYNTAKPYYRNPRQITKTRLSKLDDNLVKYGDLGGIVHNRRSNQIIGGNQRTAVAKLHDYRVEIVTELPEPDAQGSVAFGFIYFRKGDKETRLNYRVVDWDAEIESAANLVANTDAGLWDFDIAANQWQPAELMEWAGWNDDLLKSEKQLIAALDSFLESEKQEKEIDEETEAIRPKEMTRILVSVPVDSAIDARLILDELRGIDGVEIIYGAN